MEHKKLAIYAVFLLGIGLTGLKAQTMYVKENSGTLTSYSLSNIRKMSFTPGNITINNFEGTTYSFSLLNIRYLNFTNLSTEIQETTPMQEIGKIMIFPNPVADLLNIKSPTTVITTGSIEIFSMDGVKVYIKSINFNTENIQINLSDLPMGFYICKIYDGTSIEITKFFKQ